LTKEKKLKNKYLYAILLPFTVYNIKIMHAASSTILLTNFIKPQGTLD